ncbi:YdcH family protein [Flavobacterium sp. SM15]|uniref:YdcH family protein n=1 Tax=Flavobacterium sp. SM15 TaxID=2908005 RepID=UPI001EDBAB99|nr:YdcH family protein [Flavobacterium sp. SM15]MCG2611078.1 YdcH family protein [Flavobacterium sp. SM15]
MITRHILTDEFPEFTQKIYNLKTDDNHFKKLFQEFNDLDHEIYRIEADAEPASDDTLNELKTKRVHLKDTIYSYLQEN